MPARNALVHSFLAVRLIWLNEREPQWLIALRARPEAQANVWHRSSPFYSQLEVRAAEGGARRLSRVDDRSGGRLIVDASGQLS